MTVPLASPETSCEQSYDEVTHDVMCLVKRDAYELAFAVPHLPRTHADEAQPCLHVRVKQPCQAGGFVLDLEDVESFYEDLLQMIEYWQIECQKIGRTKPMA